ncbi:MAG: hypothetical protein Kow0067_10870 [Coriobacteriia bacterium]
MSQHPVIAVTDWKHEVDSMAERRTTIAVSAVAGNVFLGIAVGLLGYYALTSGLAFFEQRQLRGELAPLGAVARAQSSEIAVESGPRLDFEGWEGEDQAYWESLPDGGVFGRIVIERMELDAVVVKGAGTEELKRGPGWIDWTQLPGPAGTFGVAGHRTTYGAPFRDLDTLEEGDVITFLSPYRRYVYIVSGTQIVTPDRGDVLFPRDEPMLGLSACHPPYSAAYRYIVHARLAEVRRISDGPEG